MDTKRNATQHRGAQAAQTLLMIAVATGVVLVFELVRANVSAARLDEWPWRLHLLGAPTAASLLVAALVAWIARDQYARSVAPTLRYTSQWAERPAQVELVGARFRQVVLRNAGPGTAVVTGVGWRVGTGDRVVDIASMEELRGYLTELDLADGRDYAISNYTPGTSLSPHEEALYFECTDTALARFRVFEAEFRFESLLGDRFLKPVSLLPHAGASTVAARAPATA